VLSPITYKASGQQFPVLSEETTHLLTKRGFVDFNCQGAAILDKVEKFGFGSELFWIPAFAGMTQMIRTKLSPFPRRRESRTMDHINVQQSILNWYTSSHFDMLRSQFRQKSLRILRKRAKVDVLLPCESHRSQIDR
jgi:hypothetical protein